MFFASNPKSVVGGLSYLFCVTLTILSFSQPFNGICTILRLMLVYSHPHFKCWTWWMKVFRESLNRHYFLQSARDWGNVRMCKTSPHCWNSNLWISVCILADLVPASDLYSSSRSSSLIWTHALCIRGFCYLRSISQCKTRHHQLL